MSRHSKDNSAAKMARKAKREAKKAARMSEGKPGSLPFPGSSHIKRNTHGTSNEISFSVLHARKNSIESATGKRVNGVPSTPRTMAEVAAEKARDDAHAALGITSSAEEVSRRSNQSFLQRNRRIALIAGGCALALCAIAFVVVSSLNLGEVRQNELTPAIDVIEEADNTLFAFDGIVVNAMSSTLAEMVEQDMPERYEFCLPTLTSVEDQLKQARVIIQQAQPGLASAADQEAANQILDTLSVREDLITTGEHAMDETVVLIDLYECVDGGWNGLLDADALARDAAALSAYTTSSTLEAALAKTDEAIDAFATVRAQFTQAREDIVEQRAYQAVTHPTEQASQQEDEAIGKNQDEQFEQTNQPSKPAAGDPEVLALLSSLDDILAHYLEYIDLRINAQYEAKRSTQAVIDHDSAVAQEANDSYNLLDSRAVSFIRGTVEQPTEYVTKVFELEREGLFAAYVQARSRASEYDAYLGDYLATLGR